MLLRVPDAEQANVVGEDAHALVEDEVATRPAIVVLSIRVLGCAGRSPGGTGALCVRAAASAAPAGAGLRSTAAIAAIRTSSPRGRRQPRLVDDGERDVVGRGPA